jgi:hypothetical protein
VNIAARLEGIAEPGTICLSEDAYRQVKARLDLGVSDLGLTQLKNIVEPVRVYSLQVGVPAQANPAPQAGPAPPEEPSAGLALPDKPSIAVLPFQNISGDPEQEYFAEGMVEDIITGLARIHWLFVIARNWSFVYKGKAIYVKQVGRELGGYALAKAISTPTTRRRTMSHYPLLERALELDPHYALAHGHMAYAPEQRFMRGGFDSAVRESGLWHARGAMGVAPKMRWR